MKYLTLWALLALIWSSSYAAIKLGVESISPLTLVAVRMLIGTSLMLILLRVKSLSLPTDPRSLSIFFISGIMGSVVPFSLIGFGEIHVESGLAALLMGIAPVVTVLLAPLVHPDEKLTPSAVAGICIGTLGLIVLVGPESLNGLGSHLAGQAAILGAALCYAFTTLYVRKYASRPALEMAAGSMLTGTVVIVIAALILESPTHLPHASAQSIIAVLYLGLFPTALATLIYFYLVPRIGAARMSQVNFVVPVVGAFLGVIFLGEILKPTAFVALALILIAVYLVTRKKRAGHRHNIAGRTVNSRQID